MAHLRSSSTVSWFPSGFGWRGQASKPFGIPEGGAGGSRCRRLLFEIVDRKKEKRGRRSPCGLFPSRAQACLGRSQMRLRRSYVSIHQAKSIADRASETRSACLGLVKRCDRADQDLKLES